MLLGKQLFIEIHPMNKLLDVLKYPGVVPRIEHASL